MARLDRDGAAGRRGGLVVLEARVKARAGALLLAAACLAALLAACGQSRVVRRDYDAPRRADTRAPWPDSRAAAQPLPSAGVHVVRRGETLYGISFRYGLRYQDVAAWNGIVDPYVIEIGQRLRLRPASSRTVATSPPRPRPQNAMPAPRTSGSVAPPANAVIPSTRPPATGGSASTTPRQAPPVQAPATPSRAPTPASGPAPAWRWPTQGQIIGRYVAGDPTQQGINIAGTAGQPVLAAGDGIVVYSGAGLVGYGELIILKHSDEWLSAYAHNRKRLVAEGARVKAGDTIAEMGRTGAIRDMLHFEIRRNGKPVDPLKFLPGP
jgi:lipoprotein NlpD